MIKFTNTGGYVQCDFCNAKAEMDKIRYLVEEGWHPPWYSYRMPSKNELENHAKRFGIQYFRRGKARRNHGLTKPAYLCSNCEKQRRISVKQTKICFDSVHELVGYAMAETIAREIDNQILNELLERIDNE